jgi:hypothetical protein
VAVALLGAAFGLGWRARGAWLYVPAGLVLWALGAAW